jgi:beta-glucanase (GH16 family)
MSRWITNHDGTPGQVSKPFNTKETACYDPKLARVTQGELRLEAIRSSCTANGRTYPYRSGIVESLRSYTFTHGAFEARIWTPTGKGLWPAFWATGKNFPRTGELDVLEAYGTDKSTYHYHYAGCGGQCNLGGWVNVAGARTGWHTYAANWQSDKITWYYDGRRVWATPTMTHAPMSIIVNLGLNSGAAAVPATMRVDYVRVWQ